MKQTCWNISSIMHTKTYLQPLVITLGLLPWDQYIYVIINNQTMIPAYLHNWNHLHFRVISTEFCSAASCYDDKLALISLMARYQILVDAQAGYSLTLGGWDKMAAIFQATFSNVFSWMKMLEFRLKFHWSLFASVQLTIFRNWFRYWLGGEQGTNMIWNKGGLFYWYINIR